MPVPIMRVGAIEIIAIEDSRFPCPCQLGFPTVSADQWRAVAPEVADAGVAHLSIGCYVVRTRAQTILVDAGIGPHGAPALGIGPGRLPEALSEAGLSLDDISIVAITHLHSDHVGWNTHMQHGRVVPTFRQARYCISRAEYDYWTAPERLAQAPFLQDQAVALVQSGRADLYEGEATIADGLIWIGTPGHTPAHASIAIHSAGERAFIIGDVAHHPAQVTDPTIRAGFDNDGEQAERTREALWRRIDESGARVAAGHFPYPGFGRIIQADGQRRWHGIEVP